MRYAGIDYCDLCNGKDIGMSLYVQGCEAHCKNCFNPETWDFEGGEEWTKEIECKFLESVGRSYIKRVSFLGGEPLAKQNIDKVSYIITKIKQMYPEKEIWIYTGNKFEFIYGLRRLAWTNPNLLLAMNNSDYIVDGLYMDELHDSTLPFRGSNNQRIWHRVNDTWVDETERFT